MSTVHTSAALWHVVERDADVHVEALPDGPHICHVGRASWPGVRETAAHIVADHNAAIGPQSTPDVEAAARVAESLAGALHGWPSDAPVEVVVGHVAHALTNAGDLRVALARALAPQPAPAAPDAPGAHRDGSCSSAADGLGVWEVLDKASGTHQLRVEESPCPVADDRFTHVALSVDGSGFWSGPSPLGAVVAYAESSRWNVRRILAPGAASQADELAALRAHVDAEPARVAAAVALARADEKERAESVAAEHALDCTVNADEAAEGSDERVAWQDMATMAQDIVDGIRGPTCAVCGAPAVCFGGYDGAPRAYACGDCCGHGNEGGSCERLAATPEGGG